MFGMIACVSHQSQKALLETTEAIIMEFHQQNRLPSGYVKIAIENGHL